MPGQKLIAIALKTNCVGLIDVPARRWARVAESRDLAACSSSSEAVRICCSAKMN